MPQCARIRPAISCALQARELMTWRHSMLVWPLTVRCDSTIASRATHATPRHPANPGLPPPMPLAMLDMFPLRMLHSTRLRGDEPVADRVDPPRLLFLDRQYVGHNGVGNLGLRPHGVARHRRALQWQDLQ